MIVVKEDDMIIVHRKGWEVIARGPEGCKKKYANKTLSLVDCEADRRAEKSDGWFNWGPFMILQTPSSIIISDSESAISLGPPPQMVIVDMVFGANAPRSQPLENFENREAYIPERGMLSKDMIHKMELERRWFEEMIKERKIVEGRLWDEKRKRIKVGHVIMFVSENERIFAEVQSIRLYPNFKEMIVNEGLERVLPGVETVEDAIKVYRKYYGEQEEYKYGVVALELRLL